MQNWLKMTLYNPNLDLINVYVYTKFGLILCILCQDIEKNVILTVSWAVKYLTSDEMISCLHVNNYAICFSFLLFRDRFFISWKHNVFTASSDYDLSENQILIINNFMKKTFWTSVWESDHVTNIHWIHSNLFEFYASEMYMLHVNYDTFYPLKTRDFF